MQKKKMISLEKLLGGKDILKREKLWKKKEI